MNYRFMLKIIGNVLKYELALLLLPLAVAIYYGEGDAQNHLSLQ